VWPTISRSCAQAQLFKAGPLLDRTVECVMANDYRVKRDGTSQARKTKKRAHTQHDVMCADILLPSLHPSRSLGVDLLVSDCARKVGGTVYENVPHLFQVQPPLSLSLCALSLSAAVCIADRVE
jgi:hypothetical protein